VKTYPALQIRAANTDRLFAAIDDLAPTAIDERDDSVRVFFSTAEARDEARSALAPHFDVSPVEVPGEDWARRSQDSLTPVTVGRIRVAPPWAAAQSSVSGPTSPITVVIQPSMGFGTGHHVTTRMCLAALQTLDLASAFVLDVGTGSGVLAIASARLGAARALGIDHDADAVQSAQENLRINPAARHVTFAVDDVRTAALPPADVVTANLTGALLVSSSRALLSAVRGAGTLIVSGLLAPERDDVMRGLTARGEGRVWEQEEDGWVGLAVKKS
jgi:ribosomal protein L11 methyltransferase